MAQIVPISETHVASFRMCIDAVAKERRFLAQVEALPLESVQGFVAQNVASDAVQFVAIEREQVIGWADIFPAWAHAVTHCGTLGMGVLLEYRGQGIGKRLLQTCISKAHSKGITRIELVARADNARAIALYEHLGFKHEARKRHAMRFDGVYYDAVQMSLLQAEI